MTSSPSSLQPPATPTISSKDTTLALAKQLAYELTITSGDWHRLKSNRQARALEQISVAIVYLLDNQTDEALTRLHQATGWLDRTISAPPCPTHGSTPSRSQTISEP
jgi:ABC-type lipoprotein release transport system permease subunit